VHKGEQFREVNARFDELDQILTLSQRGVYHVHIFTFKCFTPAQR